jgi:hypothetical protein
MIQASDPEAGLTLTAAKAHAPSYQSDELAFQMTILLTAEAVHSSVEIVLAEDWTGCGCAVFEAVSSSRALRRVKSQ